jgi:adenylate cyclase
MSQYELLIIFHIVFYGYLYVLRKERNYFIIAMMILVVLGATNKINGSKIIELKLSMSVIIEYTILLLCAFFILDFSEDTKIRDIQIRKYKLSERGILQLGSGILGVLLYSIGNTLATTKVYIIVEYNIYIIVIFTIAIIVWMFVRLINSYSKNNLINHLAILGVLVFVNIDSYLLTQIKIQQIYLVGLLILLLLQDILLVMRLQNSINLATIMVVKNIEQSESHFRFVPKEMLSILGKNNWIDVELGDSVKKDMAIMFADIRGFTSISEKLSPQETFQLINTILKNVGPIITDNNGFINKYLGDGFLACFSEGAENAVKAAKEIQDKLVNIRFENNVKIEMGIGIHYGQTILGTVGERERIEATVISDTVNVASRIESLNKEYGTKIIISKEVFLKISNKQEFEYLDDVVVKGKEQKISIYKAVK